MARDHLVKVEIQAEKRDKTAAGRGFICPETSPEKSQPGGL